MKKLIKLFITSLILVLTCSCGQPEWADKEQYMFLGKESFWMHGYIEESGYEHFMQMTVTNWIIDGHEYMCINGTDPTHLPTCKTCKQEREELVKKYVGELGKELSYKIDSLYTEGKKTTEEIKTIVRQNTQRTIREVQKVLQKQE